MRIILPTFNRAHFLEQAFRSLASQKYQVFEIIIVDDGSTDNTKDVINTLTTKVAQPVRYIYQENQGPGAARQNGIYEASGELLAFFDSDDEWLPEHLSEGVDVLKQFSSVTGFTLLAKELKNRQDALLLDSTFYTDLQPNKLFSIANKRAENISALNLEDAALLQLQDGIDSGLQNSVVRKNVFDKISIPPFRVGEDRLLILMAIKMVLTFFLKIK